jgi:glycosyltransferase involved in cell wall biosynthesis
MRSFHLIRELSQSHEIDLLSFITPSEVSLIPEMRTYVRHLETVPFSKPKGLIQLALGALKGLPFQVALYHCPSFQQALGRLLKENKYDVIVCTLLRMTENLKGIDPSIPVVGDFIDSMNLNFSNRLAQEKGLMKWVVKEEVRRLNHYESEAAKRFQAVTVVSNRDRDAIGTENVHVIPIGVDGDKFKPLPEVEKQEKVIFTGNLGYFPNVNAVSFFAKQVMPLLRKKKPSLIFEAAGVNPSKALFALNGRNGVTIKGFVDDMALFINSSLVSVCPMQSGSGAQFKMIEAMACGVPVVATDFAAEGLDVENGIHFLRANSPEEIAGAIVQLIDTPALQKQLSEQAKQLVAEKYSWKAAATSFEKLLVSCMGD